MGQFNTFPIPTQDFYLSLEKRINVLSFGAVGDGVTDDTTAIQNAIDFAFNNSMQEIYLPPGKYRTTRPLWLDVPGQLRGNYPAWSNVSSYNAGDRVSFNGMPWQSLVSSNLNNTPALNGTNFTATGNWSSSNNNATGVFVFWKPVFDGPVTTGSANIHFRGGGAQGRTDGWGSIIETNFNNAPGIVLGPGNGQAITSIAINGGGGAKNDTTDGGTVNSNAFVAAYRWGRGLPADGVGILQCGASVGSRQFIQKVAITGFSVGIKTGGNGDGLGDFNIYYDLFFYNCAIGLYFSQTQNFINEIYNSNISCSTAVRADVGTGANVVGGNYSTMDEQTPACAFTYGSATRVDDQTFTVVLATSPAPDPVSFRFPMFDAVATGQLTLFAVNTTNYGIIPARPSAYNPSTRTLTLVLANNWSTFNRYEANLSTNFDLVADLQAQTLIYAVEEAVTFLGNGIHVYNIHHENICVTRFFDTSVGFNQATPSCAQGVQFNSQCGYTIGASWTGKEQAEVYCQYSTPFIGVKQGSLELRDCALNTSTLPELAFKVYTTIDDQALFTDNLKGFYLELRSAGITDNSLNGINSPFSPGGWFDRTPVLALGPWKESNQSNQRWWRESSISPAKGFFPAYYTRPTVLNTQFNTLIGTLPTINAVAGAGGGWFVGYPPIAGGQLHSVQDFDFNSFAPPDRREFMSNHAGYSYGQSLPVSYNCKGHSNIINVSDVGLFFPGLVIKVTTDIVNTCLVVGVFTTGAVRGLNPPWAGYLEVITIAGGTDFLSGVKTTVYSGASVGQPAFDFHIHNPIPSGRTVAQLPAASLHKGDRAMVTDATATTFWSIVAGGGGNFVPVTSDGTNWRVG